MLVLLLHLTLQKLWPDCMISALVEIEKLLDLWVEDMHSKRVLTDSKVLPGKALRL